MKEKKDGGMQGWEEGGMEGTGREALRDSGVKKGGCRNMGFWNGVV